MKKLTLILGIGIILFCSCAKEESENVKQDSIYTIYELFYNLNTDKTTAQATFRFGGATGTLLDLNAPAISTFNGDELLYNSVSGVHKKEYAGIIKSGTFIYTDLDNNTFTNTTPTMDSISFPLIDTISSGSAFTFQWVGNPVGTKETITLTIDGIQQGNFEVFSKILVGATEIILPVNKLQNLGIGNASCTLTRAFNKYTVDQGTSKGGRMAVRYATTKTIYISN
ncbi:hypothetical protein ACFLQ5_02035 [Bacteroidota bacterium]